MGFFKRLFGRKSSAPDPRQLLQTIWSFIQAPDWPKSQKIVERHPELLTEDADILLEYLWQAQETEGGRRVVDEHRALLRRCRDVGMEAAFAERIYNAPLPDGTPPEIRATWEALANLPPAQLAAIDHLLKQAADMDSPEKLAAFLLQHPELCSIFERFPNPANDAVPIGILPILEELARPVTPQDMPQRIVLCEQALQQVDPATQPQLWGTLHGELGNCLAQNQEGNPAENLEQAIFHFEQALQVFTRAAFPEQWAMTQNNLANAYRSRLWGDPVEDLEQAIHHFEQALQIFTPAAFPKEWAATQNNLAVAYTDRTEGDKADNLEQAIYHYEQALQVYTRAAFPEEWAGIQNNLANAYRNPLLGDPMENLEQAIHHFRQALQVYTRAAFPKEWAAIQYDLEAAFAEIVLTEQYQAASMDSSKKLALVLDSLDLPIELQPILMELLRPMEILEMPHRVNLCRQALTHISRAEDPLLWATMQGDLGISLGLTPQGARADNLELAMQHLQQALEVLTRQTQPLMWATTIGNLAAAYRSRIRGVRADNLELAIQYGQQALEVMTRQSQPLEWATTIANLAAAYRSRIRGVPADNLEFAIQYYQQPWR